MTDGHTDRGYFKSPRLSVVRQQLGQVQDIFIQVILIHCFSLLLEMIVSDKKNLVTVKDNSILLNEHELLELYFHNIP